MSWDVIIAKAADTNYCKPAESTGLLPMGTPGELHAKLDAVVPAIHWTSNAEGHAYVGSLSLEFSLGGKTDGIAPTATPLAGSDQVQSIGVSARGSGDPVATVVAIARKYQWSVADAQDGAWVDLNAPSHASWNQFTEYRDKMAAGGYSEGGAKSTLGQTLLITILATAAVIVALRYFFKKA
jgi:hypothetical protein